MTLSSHRTDREFDKFEDVDGKTAVNVNLLNALIPEKYDEVDLAYTGSDLTTVTYKLSSNTVATLTLSYTGGLLTNVIKT